MESLPRLVVSVLALLGIASALLSFGGLLRDWWRARSFREQYRASHHDEGVRLEAKLAADPRLAEHVRPVAAGEILKGLGVALLLTVLLFALSWWRNA